MITLTKVFYKNVGEDATNGHAYFVSNHYLRQKLKDEGLHTTNIEEADIIYVQENVGGLDLFNKYPNKVKIVQLVCSHPDFYCNIYYEEMKKWGMMDIRPREWAKVRKPEIDMADYVVVYSKFTKQTCIDAGVPEDKIIVIPKGVEVSYFQPKPKENVKLPLPDTDKPIIGFAGQYQLIKGIQYLPLYKDYHLIMAGDKTLYMDNEGQREWQCKKLNLFRQPKEYGGLFTDYGQLKKEQMVDFYNMCDIMVFPSLEDSFSMVTLESLSCGKPVITTYNTGAGELLTIGNTGSRVPIRDSLALHKAIMRWIPKVKKDKTEIERQCREIALEHSMERYMNDILRFLKDVKLKNGNQES